MRSISHATALYALGVLAALAGSASAQQFQLDPINNHPSLQRAGKFQLDPINNNPATKRSVRFQLDPINIRPSAARSDGRKSAR